MCGTLHLTILKDTSEPATCTDDEISFYSLQHGTTKVSFWDMGYTHTKTNPWPGSENRPRSKRRRRVSGARARLGQGRGEEEERPRRKRERRESVSTWNEQSTFVLRHQDRLMPPSAVKLKNSSKHSSSTAWPRKHTLHLGIKPQPNAVGKQKENISHTVT